MFKGVAVQWYYILRSWIGLDRLLPTRYTLPYVLSSGRPLLKPGAKKSVHHFVAPCIWAVVGVMLFLRGYGWIDPDKRVLAIGLALVVGSLKSLFILDAAATKSLQRIARFTDGTCIGAVYSWKSWLMAGVMMAFGFILRNITTPGTLVGSFYCAIGWALIFSSRHGWRSWIRIIRHNAFTQ